MKTDKINNCIKCILGACIVFLTLSCSDNDPIQNNTNTTTSYKIAVVMPSNMQTRLKRVAEWFMSNTQKSQTGMEHKIQLEIEWVDESADGWLERTESIVADTSYRAVIGPYTSDDASKVAIQCAKRKKTLILPTASSAELQRMYAGKGYVWCLSEPDIAQCELMLTHAKLYGAKGVYLVAPDNTYGRSFFDWIGFQASEIGLKLYDVWTYRSSGEIKNITENLEKQVIARNTEDVFQTLLFIPSAVEDLTAFDEATTDTDLPFILHTVCSDVACSPEVAVTLKSSISTYDGFALSASPASGFNYAYAAQFDDQPANGDAHLYDALLLAFYGICKMETTGETDLNESLKAVVDGREGTGYSWMVDDMRQAVTAIRASGSPDIDGVTGTLEFDAQKYTTVLHSTYAQWTLYGGKYSFLGYESTDGSLRTSSSSAVWDWAKTYMQFDENINISYPTLDDRWALIVSTSTSWNNYRHQADAFAMYQVLKRHGYDDDHIVLIVSDDYAQNNQNPTPGKIRVRSEGGNVYNKKAIDYDIKDISPNDLLNILSGNSSDRLPAVLHPDTNDNVFVFWTGHGSVRSLPWRENGLSVSDSDIRNLVLELYNKRCYRQMLFAIEACYSGSIGEKCKGIPGLLVMTAANGNEPSWAEQKDPDMHIYLSNAFTRTFEETIDENPDIKLRDLYYNLARTTSGSHVMVYNADMFGNLYRIPMSDFLGNSKNGF